MTCVLRALPDYPGWRQAAIREARKWDPQVGDHETLARCAVVLSSDTLADLAQLTERLARETTACELALLRRPELWPELGLPAALRRVLRDRRDPPHLARLMRFDLHPTAAGWRASEVNADVPGGLNEAGPLAQLAAARLPGCRAPPDPLAAIATACARLRPGARCALVHATSYSDDRQQMEGLAVALRRLGCEAIPCAPDHVGNGRLLLLGAEGPIDAIIRFFPSEWLPGLPAQAWRSWSADWTTPACNHTSAVLVQSKRLPLVWDRLGVELTTWREVLPPCRSVHWRTDPTWVRKPAWGRVGAGIGVTEAIDSREGRRITWQARLHPRHWVEQGRFTSVPLAVPDAPPLHLALGCFAVDGRFAGCYARLSPWPRIDERAADAPVVVEE